MLSKSKNIVVTGGNNGIGYETVKGLFKDGHNIIFGSRNTQKNEETRNEIVSENKDKNNSINCFRLDLAVRESV